MTTVTGNSKIAKNTIALYIRMGITMIISFFTARVTLQVLGVDDYGLNNLVGSIVAMFSFINGSMGTAVQRFYSIEIGKNNEGRLNKIFGVGMYLHLIVAFITVIIAELFAIFFLSKLNIPIERIVAAQVVFQISIVSLFLNIVLVPYIALLRAREDFSKMAIVEIIQALLRLGVLYFLVVLNYDKLIVLSFCNFGVTLFYIFANVFLARNYEAAQFCIVRDKLLIKEMLSFVSLLLITVLASLLRTKGLVLLINLFFGLTVNAAYAIAAQISGIVNGFTMSFKQSVVPQIMAEYGSGNIMRMNKLIFSGTKITFLLLLLITFPVMMESYYLLNLWLVDVPQYADIFVILVLINVNVSSFSYFVYQSIHAVGKIKAQQAVMCILYMINIVFVYLVFKLNFTFFWAMYITIAISAIQCASNLYFAKKLYNFNIKLFFSEVLIKSIIFVMILFGFSFPIFYYMESSIVRLILICVVSIATIFLVGYYFYLNIAERTTLVNMIPGIKNKIRF